MLFSSCAGRFTSQRKRLRGERCAGTRARLKHDDTYLTATGGRWGPMVVSQEDGSCVPRAAGSGRAVERTVYIDEAGIRVLPSREPPKLTVPHPWTLRYRTPHEAEPPALSVMVSLAIPAELHKTRRPLPVHARLARLRNPSWPIKKDQRCFNFNRNFRGASAHAGDE